MSLKYLFLSLACRFLAFVFVFCLIILFDVAGNFVEPRSTQVSRKVLPPF